jgi:hypothetical protein
MRRKMSLLAGSRNNGAAGHCSEPAIPLRISSRYLEQQSSKHHNQNSSIVSQSSNHNVSLCCSNFRSGPQQQQQQQQSSAVFPAALTAPCEGTNSECVVGSYGHGIVANNNISRSDDALLRVAVPFRNNPVLRSCVNLKN